MTCLADRVAPGGGAWMQAQHVVLQAVRPMILSAALALPDALGTSEQLDSRLPLPVVKVLFTLVDQQLRLAGRPGMLVRGMRGAHCMMRGAAAAELFHRVGIERNTVNLSVLVVLEQLVDVLGAHV